MNSASKKKKVSEGLKNLFSSTPGQAETPENAGAIATPAAPPATAPVVEPPQEKKPASAKPASVSEPAAKPAPAPKPVAPASQPVAAKPISAPEPEPAPAPVPAPAPEKPVAEALPVKEQNGGSDEVHLVVFTLGGESFGLDISVVESIIKMQSITIVPHALAYIEGVTNLRGTVLSVIDLRTRFGLPRAEPTRDTRIVVVENGGVNIGLIVDAVTEVIHVPQSAIEPPSLFVVGLDALFITGIAKLSDRLLTLVDLEKMFVGQERTEKTAAQPV